MPETDRVYRPIFKPLRDKFKPFGVPAGKFLLVMGITAGGLALALATGGIQHRVSVPYTAAEHQTVLSEYESAATALDGVEAQRIAQGAPDYSSMELSSAQAEAVEKAAELGLTAGMSDEQVALAVPEEHVVSEPVFPDALRFAVLVALPALVGFSLFLEVNRTSAYKELKRAARWAGSQKTFKSRPIDYVERRTGGSYWEALARVRR